MNRSTKKFKILKLKCQKDQSTLEYAMETVIAIVISDVLITVANRKIPRYF